MKTDVDFFKYRLPEKSAEYYANRAIKILKQIKKQFPKQYKDIFRSASEVLTISGVRAYDTYYELGAQIKPNVISDLIRYLEQQGIWLVLRTFEAGGVDNKANSFSVINLSALKELPKQYRHLPGWVKFNPARTDKHSDFFLWLYMWQQEIATLATGPAAHPQLKDWVESNWFAPHDITYGTLLGYPGEAICSSLLSFAGTTAKIAHAEKYDGALPLYGFDRSLIDNPNIIKHQKLWSDILDKVYAELD